MALSVGEVIQGKYRITGLIGEGGMGAVYSGENVRIQRKVAIKVLHAAFTQNAEVVQRFEREAQAAGRIGNDHILEVLDLGTFENGDLFLVMEFLDGEPLSSRIEAAGRLSPEQVVPIFTQCLAGLQAAHDAGIIHRDLKPDNVFILRSKAGQSDFVKLIDFGISKFQPMGDGDGMKMTRTGTMMGTPYYLSPEQATGSSEVDRRSDLYAMGVILYECLTGAVPFDAQSFNQLLFKIALSEPPPLTEVVPDIDPAFASIVGKAMAREPADRFQTAKEFAEALEQWAASGTAVLAPAPADPKELAARLEAAVRSPAGSSPDLAAAAAMTKSSPGESGELGGTAPGFATTAPPERRPSKRIVLGVAAAVALAGIAFAATRLTAAPPPTAALDAASSAQAPAAQPPPESAAHPVEPEVAPAASQSPSAEPAADVVDIEKLAVTPEEPAPEAAPATKASRPGRPAAKKTGATADSPPKNQPAAPVQPARPDFGY